MISKSVMTATAIDAGGNAVFIENDTITVAIIDENGITIVARRQGDSVFMFNDEIDTGNEGFTIDEDAVELLGSYGLTAGGNILAKRADNNIALVKGIAGWVGVRA